MQSGKKDPMRALKPPEEENSEDIEVNLSDVITVLNERNLYIEAKINAISKEVKEIKERISHENNDTG